MRVTNILSGAVLGLLILSLTACAGPSAVVETRVPEVPEVLWGRCEHPQIAPETARGLVQGLTRYHGAVEECKAAQDAVRGYLDRLREGPQ